MTTNEPTTPIESHTTITGETVEYPRPTAEVARFLSRLRAAAEDPRVSENELVQLMYGRENPILDQTLLPGRGMVTTAVFADPLYRVMLDLLDAKRVQVGTLDPVRASDSYTMTVSEAAERLKMSTSAVRQAIKAGRLAAWKKGGVHMLDPHSVATYRDHVARRGPRSEREASEGAEPALRVRMGNRPGASFRVKAPGLEVVSTTKLEGGGKVIEATVPRFARAAIAFSGKEMNRAFFLVPADEENSFTFDAFEIRGRYRVAEKINDAVKASKAFKAFEAE